METAKFSYLLNHIQSWPKTPSEIEDLVGQIARTMNVRCVALVSPQKPHEVAVSFSGGEGTENFNREGFKDYLKEYIKQIDLKDLSIKKVQVPRKGFYLPLSVQTLAFFPVFEDLQKKQGGVGSLVIGTEKPLSEQDEVAFVAVADHFSELLRIASLESEVNIRNQFLSIASHELKTPLTSIYGILQLQERMLRKRTDKDQFPEQERHHNFLKMVIRQVERLNELIDGLLDVSRIQNGRFMVEPSDSDVALLLKEVIQARLQVIAQEASVKLNVDAPAHFVVRVDPVRMEEVISNLVMNAIRFSPEGGVVWIRLREEDGSFRLTVRDQGPSIPMEDRERIFQPFERAQRTARMGGLGLGLFISRQIAQLHGGNVSLVESVPGKGNVFEAYFPIRPPQLVSA